jgi:Xaa-Pro aminopeptidase
VAKIDLAKLFIFNQNMPNITTDYIISVHIKNLLMFSIDTYRNRRKELIEAMAGQGTLLLMGNNEVPMNYMSNPFRFRQDSNFLYFVGLDQPGLAVTIDTTSDKVILYGNEVDVEDAVWTGSVTGLSELAELSGITKVRPIDTLSYHLQRANFLHYLPPYPADRKNFLASVFLKTTQEIETSYSHDFVQAVVRLRSIKTDEEVVQIEDALNRATAGFHVEAMKMAVPDEYEYRIAGQIESSMLKNFCTPAYPTICTVHGEILHNHHHKDKLRKGQLLLVDAGAENELHYASDITRTSPVGGKFSQQQKDIYQIVLKTLNESIQLLKPGITYKSVHKNASKIIASGLIELGLLKGNAEEVVDAGAHALFFPHGLGHMLGLDVHDMEDLGEDIVGYDETVQRSKQFGTAYLRLARELEPGFVLTVEPGIYFIPILIQKWKSENKFSKMINYSKIDEYINLGGIRIEDNVLITDTSHRVLGNPIPKEINEIEELFLQ